MTNESSFEKVESSSSKINYLIRPAKQIERKLIIDAPERVNENETPPSII